MNNSPKLFTSYFSSESETINDFYANTLIPFWYKHHIKFFDAGDIYIYTDIVSTLSQKLPSAQFVYMSKEDATYNLKDYNIMSTQVGCWSNMVANTLRPSQVAIYADPDAFVCNSNFVDYAETVVDHQLTKKLSPYYFSDAGLSILRNTPNTIKFIRGVEEYLMSHNTVKGAIELFYNKTYVSMPEYYISWQKVTIFLRGTYCGSRKKIDCIHGSDIYADHATHIDIHSMIREKELIIRSPEVAKSLQG